MEQKVSFYSDGLSIGAVLFEPDSAADGSCPAIVLCQGMVGMKEYFWLPALARRFVELGYVALIWDYRGVGESEGELGRLFPHEQAEDIRNALSFLESHPKVDPQRLALAGWSFGGGMVAYVAGVDERVRCAVSVVGWADGRRWMKETRRYGEWMEFLERIEKDRNSRVVTGKSELLEPGELLVRDAAGAAARERLRTTVPGMEDYTGAPRSLAFSLATAEKLIDFKPIDVVDRISPRAILYIAAERDTICPSDQVVDMYERTGEPKKLWLIPGAAHYNVYEEPYLGQVWEMTTGWLREHL